MATAAENYLDHSYDSDNYIHYYGANDKDSLTYVHNIQRLNKALLMQNNFKALKKRIEENNNAFRMSANDQGAAESIISGEVFKGLGQIGYNGQNLNGLPTPQTFDQCKQLIKEIDSKAESISGFIDKLLQVSSQITGIAPSVLENYAGVIVKEAASVGGTMQKVRENVKGSSNSKVKQSILSVILSKHNQDFFKAQGTVMGVHTDIAKILGLVKSLPDPKTSAGKYDVMTGSSTNKIGIAKGKNEIIEALKDKIIKWITEMEKATAEEAILIATLSTHKELFERLDNDIKRVVERTGNKNVKTKFIPNPQQAYWLKEAGSVLAERTSKVYKSDVSLYSNGETSIRGQMGITVKDYKDLSMTTNNGTYTISGNVDIQKGTPLLTLLLREANLANMRIHQILQFAGAHDYRGDTINTWDKDWQELIQNLTYRMFIDTLVGLRDTTDTASFIAINGYIYHVIDFIDSFIHSKSTLTMREYLGKYGNKESTRGLERSSYVALNKWVGEDIRNRLSAEERSKQAEKDMLQLMNDTKITISMNLVQVQGLRALNI